jgi:hypothetical protein
MRTLGEFAPVVYSQRMSGVGAIADIAAPTSGISLQRFRRFANGSALIPLALHGDFAQEIGEAITSDRRTAEQKTDRE